MDIRFLNCVPDENYLDDLAMQLARYDGDAANFTMQDVETAFERTNLAIKYHTTPKALFKGLSAYLMVRWFRSWQKKVEDFEPCREESELPIWIGMALNKEIDLRGIGDIASVMMFAFPNIPIERVISEGLFSTNEKAVVDGALKLSEGLSQKQIEELIKNFRNFRKGKKRHTLVSLLDIADRKGSRSLGFTRVILDVVHGEKKNLLKDAIKKILEKREEVLKAIELDYDAFYEAFDKESDKETFRYMPIAQTLGARVARSLAVIGIADGGMVGEMAEILNNPLYDPSTRAMIAYSLGKIEYVDEAAKMKAARELVTFLKRVELEEWQKQLMPRPILESIVSLGLLGFEHVGGEDVIELLAHFAYDEEHPDAKLAAVRALGVLRISGKLGAEGLSRIEATLRDKLSDSEKFVRDTTYKWLNKPIK